MSPKKGSGWFFLFKDVANHEQRTYQNRRSSNHEIGGYMLLAGRNDVADPNQNEEDAAGQRPFPGNPQNDQDDKGWDQVHEQSNQNCPQGLAFTKNIQSEYTYEDRKYNPQYPCRTDRYR